MRENEEEWLVLCRQASIEQDPNKLMRLVSQINDLLEAKNARLRGTSGKSESGRAPVFQIAYDDALLVVRADLLRARGYKVSSALGNDAAMRTIDKNQSYRVFIVGHAAPTEIREEMVRWLRANFPATKILALNPPSHPKLLEADYNFILNGPEGW